MQHLTADIVNPKSVLNHIVSALYFIVIITVHVLIWTHLAIFMSRNIQIRRASCSRRISQCDINVDMRGLQEKWQWS